MERTPLIQLQDVTKLFESKNGTVKALDNINLTVDKGDIFGIIGLSGAGKSTLVRCMNLLEKPTFGKVMIGDKNLLELSEKELNTTRHQISMIFQHFNLLMQKTVIENICFPLEIIGVPKKEAEEKARELLEVVELSEKENAYPSQLSGGQKQRVAIARALASSPQVILCDEATSALDPKTTKSILQLLESINKKYGITIVIITHEMKVVQQICHKVAIIDRGKVVEQGNVGEIFAKPQTDVAKKLILPFETGTEDFKGSKSKFIRIVFDEQAAIEPIVSKMTLACNSFVNIVYANMQRVDGRPHGQMIIQLDDDEFKAARQLGFLKSFGDRIKFEEVKEIEDVEGVE